MSGSPTEAEIITQWTNAIAIMEDTREFADTILAGTTKYYDVLLQSLEGEYTPAGLSGAVQRHRDTMSGLIEPGRALDFLRPILFEYARILDEDGGGYTTLPQIMRALYEYYHVNSKTVESRAITYDSSVSTSQSNVAGGGTIVGNGAISRLTVDEHAYNLEACNVEKKTFRCRADQNSGTKIEAEIFEFIGAPQSQDALSLEAFGSGVQFRQDIRSLHAGSGRGGSMLRNSSFSTFSSSATPKFVGWDLTTAGSGVTQDTTNYYRTHPNSSVNASMVMDGTTTTVVVKQTLANMAVNRLNPDLPYFLRVMWNGTTGSAVGGTLKLRLGSQTVSVSVSQGGWLELIIPLDTNCWFRNFNETVFDVEIEWNGPTSGTLLLDDVIFAPMQLIDGTFWVIRGNAATPVAWQLDDTLKFTDTGGAANTGKIQYWLQQAGLGYLPSTTGTPTFTEPT